MKVYVDTSVLLRRLLDQGPGLSTFGAWKTAYSSELLDLEVRRTIDRLRLQSALDDELVVEAHAEASRLERSIRMLPVTQAVIQRASLPMATVVRTLDALHLASALILREHEVPDLFFATHDAQQARAARALGFRCLDT